MLWLAPGHGLQSLRLRCVGRRAREVAGLVLFRFFVALAPGPGFVILRPGFVILSQSFVR